MDAACGPGAGAGASAADVVCASADAAPHSTSSVSDSFRSDMSGSDERSRQADSIGVPLSVDASNRSGLRDAVLQGSRDHALADGAEGSAQRAHLAVVFRAEGAAMEAVAAFVQAYGPCRKRIRTRVGRAA